MSVQHHHDGPSLGAEDQRDLRERPMNPPAPGTAAPVVHLDQELDIGIPRPARDLIRWGPVWAGLVVTLATYLLIQLALVATSVVELAEATSDDAFWSAGAALVAFLLGGITAGATAMWRGIGNGLLHGVVLWAVGIVALLVLSAVGGGIALGSFDTAEVFDRFAADDVDAAQANEDAEEAAGWALGGIGAALLAAAIGGMVGAKMWPRRDLFDDLDPHGRFAHTGERGYPSTTTGPMSTVDERRTTDEPLA